MPGQILCKGCKLPFHASAKQVPLSATNRVVYEEPKPKPRDELKDLYLAFKSDFEAYHIAESLEKMRKYIMLVLSNEGCSDTDFVRELTESILCRINESVSNQQMRRLILTEKAFHEAIQDQVLSVYEAVEAPSQYNVSPKQ